MSCRPMSLVSGIVLIRVRIYQVGYVAHGKYIYRDPKEKGARPTAATGNRLGGNISYVWSLQAVSFRDFPDQCKHLPGRFFSALYFELYDAKGRTGATDSGAMNPTV